MKALIGTIKKEIQHIIRDPRTLMLLFAMPVIQLLMFGYAVRNEVTEVDLGVVDYQNQTYVDELVQRLEATGYFKITRLPNDQNEIYDAFEKGKISAVLVAKDDVETELKRMGISELQLLLDASNPNLASIIEQYVRVNLNLHQLDMNRFQISRSPPVSVSARYLFNPELKSSWLFVPGLISVILMLVSTLMTSITIAREKEMGSIELLLVSPLQPYQIIIGKVFPYLVLSFVNVASIVFLAITVFDVPFVGNWVAFWGVSTLFILLALSLGILISGVSSSQLTAMLLSMVGLLLPTIILSGFIFPVKNLHIILQYISAVIPARWYLVVIRGIMLRGTDILILWKEVLILFVMTSGLLFMSIKTFKERLQ
ncbi:ABC transporter permease [Rhodohalobacter sp. 8-1]|uniref:ABC transporter permease n=1 Tax=Rhodohalobacter sp. 8-1 TaxID=3131972 RepID=UPI0030EF2240